MLAFSYLTATVLLALSILTGISIAAPQPQNNKNSKNNNENQDECDCWHTTGPSASYFAHHALFDFRHLSQYAADSPPPVLQDVESNRRAPPTSDYFRTSDFAAMFEPMNWDNSELMQDKLNDAELLMINSPNNIYIERSDDGSQGADTWMTMRTAKVAAGFQSAAELETTSDDYQFVSMRMHARVLGAPGACAAMFTYKGPFETVQEADIEILTAEPKGRVHYTNQPSYDEDGTRPEATRNATMAGGAHWDDWTTWRLDWLPGKTTWYVNGQKNEDISFQTPRDPTTLLFNIWSDGGSWSGKMKDGQQAVMQIQWTEIAWDLKEQGSCREVCEMK